MSHTVKAKGSAHNRNSKTKKVETLEAQRERRGRAPFGGDVEVRQNAVDDPDDRPFEFVTIGTNLGALFSN